MKHIDFHVLFIGILVTLGAFLLPPVWSILVPAAVLQFPITTHCFDQRQRNKPVGSYLFANELLVALFCFGSLLLRKFH